MKDYSEAIRTIHSLLNEGKFVVIKCADDSEMFIHKSGITYTVSSDKMFEKNCSNYVDDSIVDEVTKGMRGYGTYVPYDYDPVNHQVKCECDS